MTEHEVPVAENADLAALSEAVSARAAELGLRVTLDGTLGKYPGCRHWHLQRGREPGTLEVTLWPARRRLWVSHQSGRTTPWVLDLAPVLVQKLSE